MMSMTYIINRISTYLKEKKEYMEGGQKTKLNLNLDLLILSRLSYLPISSNSFYKRRQHKKGGSSTGRL